MTTYPELLECVESDDLSALMSALMGLSESKRKSIWRELSSAQEHYFKNEHTSTAFDEFEGVTQKNWHSRTAMMDILKVALGPLKVARDIAPWHTECYLSDFAWHESVLLTILRDRRPSWVDRWLVFYMRREGNTPHWCTFWPLIREGICQKAEDRVYLPALARLLNNYNSYQHEFLKEHESLEKMIEAETLLHDDIWNFFQTETTAFVGEWSMIDGGYEDYFPVTFVKLANRGVFDRDRLLDASLEGLNSGFKRNTIVGFYKLHQLAKPTKEELQQRQTAYIDLLTSHIPQVASFAWDTLLEIEQHGALDEDGFVNSVTFLFDLKAKRVPLAAIELLVTIADRTPELAGAIGESLVGALSHKGAPVQQAAADLLLKLSPHLSDGTLEEIANRKPQMQTLIQPTIEQLLAGPQGTGRLDEVDSEFDNDRRLAELRKRAEAVPDRWRKLAQIDETLAAIEKSEFPPPAQVDVTQISVLPGLQPVTPFNNIEDLVDAIAHAIERVDSPTEFERILDGMCRLCEQRPNDFVEQFKPLVVRTKTWQGRTGLPISPGVVELRRLMEAWLQSRLGPPPEHYPSRKTAGIVNFLNARIAAIATQLAKGKAAPLLSAPTHEGGWIDPSVFVERWQEWERIDPKLESLSHLDVIQGLFRLAPDHRDDALKQAQTLTHNWADALRWALGETQLPAKFDGSKLAECETDIWIAAGRSRDPHGELTELADSGLLAPGPDEISPADNKHHFHGEHTMHGRPASLLRYTVGGSWPFLDNQTWVIQWASMIWPAKPAGYFSIGASSIRMRSDEPASTEFPFHEFLPPLFAVDCPWGFHAVLMILTAVTSKSKDCQIKAVDALVTAIADGRLEATAFGDWVAEVNLLSDGHPDDARTRPDFVLKRLADNFNEVASISALHGWTIGSVLEKFLATHPVQRGTLNLLALFQDLQARFGIGISDRLRETLKSIQGKTKTAKAAAALLSNEVAGPTPNCEEVKLMLLETRIEKAERWSK